MATNLPEGFRIRRPDQPPSTPGTAPAATGSAGLPAGFSIRRPPSVTAAAPARDRTWGEVATDTVSGIAQGALNLGGAVAQAANTVTGGALDRYVVRPAQNALDRALGGTGDNAVGLAGGIGVGTQMLQEGLSEPLKRDQQAVQDADGFLGAASAVIQRPRMLGQFLAEQVPMIGTLGLGTAGTAAKVGQQALARGATKEAATEAAKTAAERGLVGANAALSGGFASQEAQQTAMAQSDEAWDQNPEFVALAAEVGREQAKQQLATRAGMTAGAIAAPLGALGAKITAPFERQVFTGALKAGGARGIAAAAGKEALEEMVQEGGEQFGSNVGVRTAVDPQQDLFGGVPEAMGIGGTVGGLLGGGMYAGGRAAQHRRQSRAAAAIEQKAREAAAAMSQGGPPPGPMESAAQAAAAAAAADPVTAAKAALAERMQRQRDAGLLTPTTRMRILGAVASEYGVQPEQIQERYPDAAPGSIAAAANAVPDRPLPAAAEQGAKSGNYPESPDGSFSDAAAAAVPNLVDDSGNIRRDEYQQLASKIGRDAARFVATAQAEGRPVTLDEARAYQEQEHARRAKAVDEALSEEGKARSDAKEREKAAAQAAEDKRWFDEWTGGSLADGRYETETGLTYEVRTSTDKAGRVRQIIYDGASKPIGLIENGQPDAGARQWAHGFTDGYLRRQSETAGQPASPAASLSSTETESDLSGAALTTPPAAALPEGAQADQGTLAQGNAYTPPPAPRATTPTESAPPQGGERAAVPEPLPEVTNGPETSTGPAADRPAMAGGPAGGAVAAAADPVAGEPAVAAESGVAPVPATGTGPAVPPVAGPVGPVAASVAAPRIEPLGENGLLVHGDVAQTRERLAAAGFTRRGRVHSSGALQFDRKHQAAIEKALAPQEQPAAEQAPAGVGAPVVDQAAQQSASSPGAARKPSDRRTNAEDRARIDALPADERDAEIARLRAEVDELRRAQNTNPVTGLPNKAAFDADESLGWPAVAAIDMDGLKRLNDHVGHEAADVVLRRLGELLQGHSNDGVRFYHRSGDEFAARFRDESQAQAAMAAIQQALDGAVIRLTGADGVQYEYNGIGISFGTGASYEQADGAANRNKADRLAAGHREEARADGPPRRLRAVPVPEGREGDGDRAAAGRSGLPDERLTAADPAAAEHPLASLFDTLISGAGVNITTEPFVDDDGHEYIKKTTSATGKLTAAQRDQWKKAVGFATHATIENSEHSHASIQLTGKYVGEGGKYTASKIVFIKKAESGKSEGETKPSEQELPAAPRIEPLGKKAVLVHGDVETIRAKLAAGGFPGRGRIHSTGALQFDRKHQAEIERALASPPAGIPYKDLGIPEPKPRNKVRSKDDFDPVHHDLLDWIALHGGLDREAFASEGIDSATWRTRAAQQENMRFFGKPVFRKAGGMSPHDLRERMEEAGWFEGGRYDDDAVQMVMSAVNQGEVFKLRPGVEADQLIEGWERDTIDEQRAAEVAADLGYNDARAMYDAIAYAESVMAQREEADEQRREADRLAARGAWPEGEAAARGVEEGSATAVQEGGEDRAAVPGREQGFALQSGRQPQAVETRPAATQQGLFAPPTSREAIDAERQRRLDELNGRTGTGRTDMMAGDGELFSGPRPEQVDIEAVAPAVPLRNNGATYGETRPLHRGERDNDVSDTDASPGRRASAPVQLDIFVRVRGEHPVASPNLPQLRRSAKLVNTGEFRTGFDRVTSWEEAAHILAPLRKSPQEQVLALVMDRDNRPLAVIRHSIGEVASSSVEPWSLIGAISSVPGARSVYFAHNHPAGNPSQSDADKRITAKLAEIMEGSGIAPLGMIVVAPGSRLATFFDPKSDGSRDILGRVRTAPRKSSVPMQERRLHRIVNPTQTIAGPDDVSNALPDPTLRESGVLLLDTRHNVLGTIPVPTAEMARLRTGSPDRGTARILSEIARANASSAIIYGTDIDAAKNLGEMLGRADVRVLDIAISDGRRWGLEAQLGGALRTGQPFFSLSDEQGSARQAPQIAPLFRMSGSVDPTGTEQQLQRQFDQVEQAINDATDQWGPNQPSVHVIRSPEDLPEWIKRKDSRYKRANGVRVGRQVWIITDRLPRGKAVQVALKKLAHEAVGHYGIDNIIDQYLDVAPGSRAGDAGWQRLTADIVAWRKNPNLHPAVRKIMDQVQRNYRQGDGTPPTDLEFAREVVAHMAEEGLRNGIMGRIVAAVRRFLRQYLPNLRVTDSEIRAMLADAETWLRQQAAPVAGPRPAAAMAFSVGASRLRDDPMEVSSRAPWGKTSTEDPIGDLLVVGLDSSRASEKAFEKNIALVREYPNYRPAKSASTTDRQAERFIEATKDNLLWLYDQVPAEIRARSHLWYDGANKIAKTWALKYDLQPAQIAGVMAVLSPQKDWFMNVDLARRVIDTMDAHGDTRWSPEMTATAQRIFGKPQYADDVKAITGKTLDEVDSVALKAIWIRTYDEAYNDRTYALLSPEGDAMGKVMTQKGEPAKVAWGDLGAIRKAVAIIQDGSLNNISARLGGEHKVRNFYNNILVPNGANGHVTIDTHAVAAALLRPLSGSSIEVLHNFGGGGAASSAIHGSSGTYGLYAEAYRRAAAERGVLPREMQSITREAVRGLFTPGFKSQQKNVDTTDGIWENYRKGRLSLENARQQILEAAGGIDEPSWFRPGAGSPTQEGQGDAGVVPGVQLPGRRAVSISGRAGGAAAEAAAEPVRSATRDGGGQRWPAEAPLPDAPAVEGATGPDLRLVAVAERYARQVGIDLRRQAEYVAVDEGRARRIAEAYEAMEHAPQDPQVREAYAELVRQTRAQYDALVDAGYEFYFADRDADPYGGNPWNAMRDLRANQRMAVFPTAAGFGSNEEFDPANNRV